MSLHPGTICKIINIFKRSTELSIKFQVLIKAEKLKKLGFLLDLEFSDVLFILLINVNP